MADGLLWLFFILFWTSTVLYLAVNGTVTSLPVSSEISYCVPRTNEAFTDLKQHGGKVINDNIFILWWSNSLNAQKSLFHILINTYFQAPLKQEETICFEKISFALCKKSPFAFDCCHLVCDFSVLPSHMKLNVTFQKESVSWEWTRETEDSVLKGWKRDWVCVTVLSVCLSERDAERTMALEVAVGYRKQTRYKKSFILFLHDIGCLCVVCGFPVGNSLGYAHVLF